VALLEVASQRRADPATPHDHNVHSDLPVVEMPARRC
jgi:hypothetical protein